MGHNICAIIGQKNIKIDKIKEFALATAFENEFAIVILDFDAMLYLGSKLSLNMDSESENIEWACELSFFISKEIGMQKYAIIQTDYFGGMGDQCASLYEDGKIVVKEKSINEILKKLGVINKEGLNEFDTLNLSEYRNSEYYYWDEHNWAEKKDNMIAGKILK